MGDECGRGFAGRRREGVKLSGSRMRQEERPVFCADGVVGCDYAAFGEPGQMRLQGAQNRLAAAKIKHEPPPGAFHCFILLAARATHDRRHRRDRLGLLLGGHDSARPAVAGDEVFGEGDHFDHALVGLAGAVAESDDAVFAEDQAVARPLPLEDLDRRLGKTETRHEIGHKTQTAAEYVGALFLPVGLIDDAENGAGMCVIDECVRQKGMQHHLNGRIGRGRIDQIGAFDRQEVFIGDGFDGAQVAQWRKADRQQVPRFDRRHVGAGGLDP
jgi:hypothetical protein